MSYTPPPVVGYAAPQMYSGAFVPTVGRAKIATICLWVSIALSVLSTILSVAMMSLIDLEEIEATKSLPGWFWPLYIALIAVGLLHFISFVVTAIFYLRWQHQAQTNLLAIGRSTQYTAGWGVGYWFIPILNLFRPFQNLRDVTSTSSPTHSAFPQLGLYWTCWLTSNILANISNKLPETAAMASSILEVISLAAEIGAAVLLIRLMKYVIEGQAQLSMSAQNVRTYQ